MIVKATFQWTVDVTIDVPDKETTINAAALLLHHAYRQLNDDRYAPMPVITKCIERPDIAALSSPHP